MFYLILLKAGNIYLL